MFLKVRNSQIETSNAPKLTSFSAKVGPTPRFDLPAATTDPKPDPWT